jgi:hypothetical protein
MELHYLPANQKVKVILRQGGYLLDSGGPNGGGIKPAKCRRLSARAAAPAPAAAPTIVLALAPAAPPTHGRCASRPGGGAREFLKSLQGLG